MLLEMEAHDGQRYQRVPAPSQGFPADEARGGLAKGVQARGFGLGAGGEKSGELMGEEWVIPSSHHITMSIPFLLYSQLLSYQGFPKPFQAGFGKPKGFVCYNFFF